MAGCRAFLPGPDGSPCRNPPLLDTPQLRRATDLPKTTELLLVCKVTGVAASGVRAENLERRVNMARRRRHKQFVAQLRIEPAVSTRPAEQLSPVFPGSPCDAEKLPRSFQMLRIAGRTREPNSCANCALKTAKVRNGAAAKASSASGVKGCGDEPGPARQWRAARRNCAGAGGTCFGMLRSGSAGRRACRGTESLGRQGLSQAAEDLPWLRSIVARRAGLESFHTEELNHLSRERLIYYPGKDFS